MTVEFFSILELKNILRFSRTVNIFSTILFCDFEFNLPQLHFHRNTVREDDKLLNIKQYIAL